MSLLITIIKSPDSVVLTESSKTFDSQGGSIGRSKDNSLVLDDPKRFLSSTHCQFSCLDGQFYITDVSTNGTFYNGSSSPMGKGTKLPVHDGDSFVLGDYEFSVNLLNSDSLADPFGDSLPVDEIFSSDSVADSFFDNDPFSGAKVSTSEPSFKEETDPLAALDKAYVQPAPSADPFAGPSHSDQASPLNQQISWPDAVPEHALQNGGIPNDFGEDLLSPAVPVQSAVQAPATDKPAGFEDSGQFDTADSAILMQENQALKKANAKIQSELKLLKKKLGTQQRNEIKNEAAVDTTLVDALGFQDQDLDDAEIAQINQLVAKVIREMVSGLMQVLGSRSLIKNEFRMNVTTIQRDDNNPLKFSANVDDALYNMFIKQGKAYIKPVEAVCESFECIADHQLAILAGIRAAFKTVVERFDPVLLEARFSRQNKGSLIPGSQKAKNWELYLEYYNEMVGDIDNTFQYLFGDDFVQSYEDQLHKLAVARKSKKIQQEK